MHAPGSGRLVVVGSIALALTLGAVGLDPRPALAAAGPTVITGAKAGPVPVPAPKVGAVAKLSLPAGGWFVTAKALLVGAADVPALTHLGVDCILKVGKRVDRIAAAPTPKGYSGSRVPILLTMAGRLASPGMATLKCVGETAAGDVVIRDIRISALRAGRLTIRVFGGGSKTSGSGSPRIITLLDKDVPPTFPGDGDYHAVDQLSLPAGRWWIVAKAVARTTLSSVDFRCQLVAGVDYDELRFPVQTPGLALDATPLGLQVVHAFPSPGAAQLVCKGLQPFQVGDVVITAIKAGTLTNRSLDTGQQAKSGSGAPRIFSGYSDGPRSILFSDTFQTVRQISLPAGRWSVLAKLWFEAGGAPHPDSRVLCRLQFGARLDPIALRYSDNTSRIGPMYLALTYESVEPGWLVLRCRRTHANGTADARFIKITALKLGSLTRRLL